MHLGRRRASRLTTYDTARLPPHFASANVWHHDIMKRIKRNKGNLPHLCIMLLFGRHDRLWLSKTAQISSIISVAPAARNRGSEIHHRLHYKTITDARSSFIKMNDLLTSRNHYWYTFARGSILWLMACRVVIKMARRNLMANR